MWLNQFSVRIPEGHEDSGGYVELPHNTPYTLVLRNNRNVRCDARVEVDGKHVGTGRIHANSIVRLERPVHDTGRFTFYKLDSPEAQQAQLNGGDPNLGLVKVTFTPDVFRSIPVVQTTYTGSWIPKSPRPTIPSPPIEWQYRVSTMADGSVTCYNASSRSAGGSGLSGQSGQHFHDAAHINYDYSQQTVIHLRLVCKNGGARPLTSFSTPIPPTVR